MEEAQGGGLTKSAYYEIYLSEKNLNENRRVDQNLYDPNVTDFEKMHPYGAVKDAAILKKIIEDNRKLMTEVDEFKAVEIAKKVTTAYERSVEEIEKIMEQKNTNKNIGSIYNYLFNMQEARNLAKRILLD